MKGGRILSFLHKLLRKAGLELMRLGSVDEKEITLRGDRDIEWSWVVSRMMDGKGSALDFGCSDGNMGIVAARRGYEVTAIDQLPVCWPYRMPGLTFVQGDLLTTELPLRHYDLILNCSTVEHVGLAGRYNSVARADGDLDAMRNLKELAMPHGKMLLTIPVGSDAVFAPLHRVYGRERLPLLIEGWSVEEEEYWLKRQDGRWVQVDAEEALDTPPKERLYGLGLFVLAAQRA